MCKDTDLDFTTEVELGQRGVGRRKKHPHHRDVT